MAFYKVKGNMVITGQGKFRKKINTEKVEDPPEI